MKSLLKLLKNTNTYVVIQGYTYFIGDRFCTGLPNNKFWTITKILDSQSIEYTWCDDSPTCSVRKGNVTNFCTVVPYK